MATCLIGTCHVALARPASAYAYFPSKFEMSLYLVELCRVTRVCFPCVS